MTCVWIHLVLSEDLLGSVLQGLLEKFGMVLHAESAGTILATATNWEDLEIQEEAESGSSVTSKIRLPVQVRRTSHTNWKDPESILRSDGNLLFLVSSVANVVCAVPAVPAVCGNKQGGRPRPSSLHPPGVSADLFD